MEKFLKRAIAIEREISQLVEDMSKAKILIKKKKVKCNLRELVSSALIEKIAEESGLDNILPLKRINNSWVYNLDDDALDDLELPYSLVNKLFDKTVLAQAILMELKISFLNPVPKIVFVDYISNSVESALNYAFSKMLDLPLDDPKTKITLNDLRNRLTFGNEQHNILETYRRMM